MQHKCQDCGDPTDGSNFCDSCQEEHDSEDQDHVPGEHRCQDCGALTAEVSRCSVCQEAHDEAEQEEILPEDIEDDGVFPDEFPDL